MGKKKIMSRRINLIVFVVLLFICFKANSVYAGPSLYTNYFCLVDEDTGQVIYEKAQDEKRAVASTTKMMTAILADEYASYTEVAKVSAKAARTPEFTIGLRAGQEVEVGELVKAALVRSSNDAAVVLAEHIAGDERFFGHLMSKKAFLLGAVNTQFVNASGLPDEEHYSTAYDLTVIARYLLSKKELSKIVAMPETTFKHPAYREAIKIRNTNSLLDNYPGASGIKTGTTNLAGKCLVASASREGKNLIAVSLKSGDRMGDCKRLLDYGFNQAKYVKVLNAKTPFKELKVNNGSKPYVQIFPKKDLYLWQAEESLKIEKQVRMDYIIDAPVKEGDLVGCLDIYVHDKFVSTIPLIARENISKKTDLIKQLKDLFNK